MDVERIIADLLLIQPAIGAQDAKRHWQVKAGAFLLNVSRG